MAAQILSPAQRAALFDPPSDPAVIERLYTLGPDDLVEVRGGSGNLDSGDKWIADLTAAMLAA